MNKQYLDSIYFGLLEGMHDGGEEYEELAWKWYITFYD